MEALFEQPSLPEAQLSQTEVRGLRLRQESLLPPTLFGVKLAHVGAQC